MAFFNFFKRLFKGKRKAKKKSRKKLARKVLRKPVKKSKKKLKKRVIKKPVKRKIRKKIAKRPKRKAKKSVKRNSKRKITKKSKPLKALKEKEIGAITHYFDKISVGIIKLKSPLAISEHIRIKGKNSEFTQVISSMQYNHKDILLAERGLEIGIKVNQPVQENDLVYKVI